VSAPFSAIGASSAQNEPRLTTTKEEDEDSAVGSFRSSTASLSSSIYEYVEENGRTYHKYKDGSKNLLAPCLTRALADDLRITEYHFPNDAVSIVPGTTQPIVSSADSTISTW
jgi:hypothetical protein